MIQDYSGANPEGKIHCPSERLLHFSILLSRPPGVEVAGQRGPRPFQEFCRCRAPLSSSSRPASFPHPHPHSSSIFLQPDVDLCPELAILLRKVLRHVALLPPGFPELSSRDPIEWSADLRICQQEGRKDFLVLSWKGRPQSCLGAEFHST